MSLESLELSTNDPECLLRLSGVKQFPDTKNYVSLLEVASRGFSCRYQFFFDRWTLGQCIESLDQMVAGQPSSAKLTEQVESDFIRFTQNQLGHVVVEGEIFEHSELSQHLKFAFRTDQTVLPGLVKTLRGWHAA